MPAPDLECTFAPAEGIVKNVAAPVIDMLYPPGKTVGYLRQAVTGTNGKTNYYPTHSNIWQK